MGLTPTTGLLAASAVHLGFQAVVTAVVYPALTDVPPERWAAAHTAHSRRIAAVVAPVYGLLATACLRVVVAGPVTTAHAVAIGGAAGAALSTALVAAPTHARLGREGARPEALARLRRADAVRLLGGGVAVVGALVAAAREP